MQVRHVINGEHVDSRDAQTYQSISPIDNSVLATVAFGGAAELANGTRYGLAGMVWTQSLDTAQRVAREVRTGNLWVNCFSVRDLRAPFGGYKDSGIGREGGDHSLEFYTEQKSVVLKTFS